MDKYDDLMADNKYFKEQIEQLRKEKTEEFEILQREKLELNEVYEQKYDSINNQLIHMQNDPFWKLVKPARAVAKSVRNLTRKLTNKSKDYEITKNDAINESAECSLKSDAEPELYTKNLHLINERMSLEETELNVRIAVQIHLYYIDLVDEVHNYLMNIPFEFDCFISTDTESKAETIGILLGKESKRWGLSGCSNLKNMKIEVFENRGRDVAPFLMQMCGRLDDYDYICHIHTKKTNTGEHGDIWREYLYSGLLGSPESIESIIAEFERNDSLGIAFPEIFPTLIPHINWSGCKELCENLLIRMNAGSEPVMLPEKPLFSAGTMFWARTKAISPIFSLGLKSEDFPKEGGQIKESLAHAVERIWVYLAKAQGYDCMVFLNMLPKALHEMNANTTKKSEKSKKRIVFYAHTGAKNSNIEESISESDLKLLKSLREISDFVVFITNMKLSKENKESLAASTDAIIIRKEIKADYGAWKDGILSVGFGEITRYDQVVLLSSSVAGPIYNLENIFRQMEGKKLDFWGITAFPACTNSLYIARNSLDVDRVPEYIESYFQVFEKSVIESKIFRDIWENMVYSVSQLIDRKNIEIKMTEKLESHGFKYDVHTKISRHLRDFYGDFDSLYIHPYPLLIAGSPFMKRELSIYAPEEEKENVARILSELELTVD